MRVLLVEDEPDLGKAIERTLKQEKYIVDWAVDGSEAWEYLDSHWTQYNLAVATSIEMAHSSSSAVQNQISYL